MKTIEIPKRSKGLNQLLAKAQRENLLLRSSNGVEFILAEINDFDREIDLQRENQDLMAFLDRRGQQRPILSASEVRKRLRLAKRAK